MCTTCGSEAKIPVQAKVSGDYTAPKKTKTIKYNQPVVSNVKKADDKVVKQKIKIYKIGNATIRHTV